MTSPRASLVVLLAVLVSLFSTACATRQPKVPGETDIRVTSVTLEAPPGQELAVGYGPLVPRLGMRAKTLIMTDRYFSDFRVAEDQRRITAYWQTFGYFDVVVDPAKVELSEAEKTAAVTWTIHENERYRIGDVVLKHAPPEQEAMLQELIPFGPGEEDVDLEKFRKVRLDMSDQLQRQGYGHAMIYSRSWVDRTKKVIHWYYFVDAGPKTRIGTITVDGNRKIPTELVIERSGLQVGEPYDLDKRERAEFDLLDTGAFASAYVRSGVDVKFIVPGSVPDTGGELRDEQIDANGDLVPRELPEELDLLIHVVEAPNVQMRIRAGLEVDPNRVDTALASRFWFRNLFAPQHHLVLEGRVGYGVIWRGTNDDPSGLYGEALARTIHPGVFGRIGDLRLTARFRDELFPGFHLREVNLGPGVRSSLATNVYFDTDVYFRYGKALGFGPFSAAERDELSLPADDESYGAELSAGIVWDERDNRFEPMKGHLLGFQAVFAPGEALNTHRYLSLLPEARGFVPVSESFSIGLRGSGGWVVLAGDDGVPLGPRLFGGGAYGMRGYGRHFLSPRRFECFPTAPGPDICRDEVVGGLSLVEASIEGRFLPALQPYGAVVFADLGGAGAGHNPFENGVSAAAGLGLRLRFWYLPIALDFAYRFLTEGETEAPDYLDPLLVFFRIGESF